MEHSVPRRCYKALIQTDKTKRTSHILNYLEETLFKASLVYNRQTPSIFVSVWSRSGPVISWTNVSLIWTSSGPDFTDSLYEAQAPCMAFSVETDVFNQKVPRITSWLLQQWCPMTLKCQGYIKVVPHKSHMHCKTTLSGIKVWLESTEETESHA